MSFFGRENFDHIRERFLDKNAVSRMFEGFREKLIAQQAAADMLLSQHPDDPDIKMLVYRTKLDVNHLSLIWEIMEATMINLINVNEMLIKIIETSTQEGEQRKTEFENMKEVMDADKQKLADLMKHQTNPEWLDKYFKSESSKTTDK